MMLLCGGALFASGCSTLHKSDSAVLQGNWSGREIGFTPATPRTIVISGTQFDYHGAYGDDWGKGSFTLREDTQPKQILVTLSQSGMPQYNGKLCYMIYKIEDGTLTIAANEPGKPEAPSKFDSSAARLMVFKRE